MPDVFSMSIPHLREWSRRQGVDHRHQNEPVEAINRMMTGVGPPRQVAARVGGGAAIVSAVAQFKLTQSAADFPDHLVCRTWDGETQGDDDVLIAKPWLLRRTPFDGRLRGSIRYTYQTPIHREARIGNNSEDQIIIPAYRIDDLIYASKAIVGGTSVIWEDVPLDWLAWTDGRAWAWTA